MKKIESTRMARAKGWVGVAGLVGASLCACSGGSSTGVGASDGGAGSSGTSGTNGAAGASGGHSGTSGDSSSSVNPTGSAPGEACNVPADCLIVYCDCTNHSLVNAQRCIDRACQTPKAACPAACMGFGTTWSGTASVEKPRTSSASSSSGSSSSSSSGSSSSSSGSGSSSGSSGSACASFADCSPYTCTCIDGQTASDQGCVDGVCVGASTGCEATCANTGHGGAQ